jgi:hypothetical protein
MRQRTGLAIRLCVVPCLALSFASVAIAQNSATGGMKPSVWPAFVGSHGGPAFRIECRNPLGTPVEPVDRRWIQSYRIDGTSTRREGGVASFLVRPPPIEGEKDPRIAWVVAPNRTWQGMLELVQPGRTERGDRDVAPDFEVRTNLTMAYPLMPGRHTIAAQCFDAWSDEVAFFWMAP